MAAKINTVAIILWMCTELQPVVTNLKRPYYAIFKAPNIVLGVSYNRFTCMQGEKKLLFSQNMHLISPHFPAIRKRFIRNSSKIQSL